jgi:GcrA cell cycle regulator
MQGKGWTPERTDALRALWAEGLSARAIADRLGDGTTRNTVIGKLDRLGLLGTRDPVAKPRTTEPRGDGEGAAPIPSPDDVLAIQARLTVPSPAPPRPRAEEVGPASDRIGIQDLAISSCRWPNGHPGSPGFGFCGARAIAGRPYCDAHAKLAYEPPRERRRA